MALSHDVIISRLLNGWIWPLYFQAKHEKEEEERKKRIQLYVFVLRSIAYTFNAKQSSDMQKRNLKVTKEGHEKMKSKVDVSDQQLMQPFFLKSLSNHI